jgi:hypothetical protein
MAEFQWWLLLVGLVAGGGLVAVVFLDGARREQDVEEAELPAEAHWIAARLGGGERRPGSGERRLDPHQVEAILREHREYRLMPPPDRLDPIDAPPAGVVETNPVGSSGATGSASGDRVESPAGESRPPR